MTAAAPFRFKTLAEQRLEYLEGLGRPLTDEESNQLQRSLHAIYCRNRYHPIVAQHENEERELLKKVEAESLQPDPGRHEI